MKIITDSASDLTLEQCKEMNIECIPMSIQIENKSVLDDKTTPMKEFWEYMKTKTVKTSQPPIGFFIELFEKLKEDKEEAIFISISSQLSGTYSEAVTAKNMVGYDKIYIIDSKSATSAQAQIVTFACQLRDQGLSIEDIVQQCEAFKSKVHILVCVDTLEYLSRGGRIPKTISSLGNAIKVKPILTINKDGIIEIYKMKRGKKKAMEALQSILHTLHTDYPVIPIYSYDPSNCKELMEGYSNITSYQEMGCTIGCHAGPDVFGFVYIES